MEGFIELLKNGKTQFHVVAECKKILSAKGYKELDTDYEKWNISPGDKYYVCPYSSMMVAFNYGKNADSMRIAAAHTDFPMLKLKPNPITKKGDYVMVNVEPYGGLIKSTWFDRPLGLAGKVVIKGYDAFSPKAMLFDSNKPLFVIPNLAPHLKRDNNKQDMDVQKELMPVMSVNKEEVDNSYITDIISRELNINSGDILDYDLYLYIYDAPTFVGARDEFLLSSRIDNISSVSAVLEALTDITSDNCISVGVFFDNEEIGSRSKQGADSMLFRDILEKIAPSKTILRNAFGLSVDVAHATHPNYPETSDITNKISLGDGVVLKSSASQRYVTDSECSAVLLSLAAEGGIKIARQANKSGMPGGQTLGPILSSYLPVKCVDIGIPMLAMHSAAETINYDDYLELVKLLCFYFNY